MAVFGAKFANICADAGDGRTKAPVAAKAAQNANLLRTMA